MWVQAPGGVSCLGFLPGTAQLSPDGGPGIPGALRGVGVGQWKIKSIPSLPQVEQSCSSTCILK